MLGRRNIASLARPACVDLVEHERTGWEPLCEFLGVEVPDKPFPHLNDADTFRRFVRKRLAFAAVATAGAVTLVGLALFRFRKHLIVGLVELR